MYAGSTERLHSGMVVQSDVIPSNPGPDPALRPPSAERLEAFVARRYAEAYGAPA